MKSSRTISVEHLLEQTATRGTWYGGGSAAALSCALSAALIEKLASRPQAIRTARTIRRRCARLIDEDARVFARAVQAMSSQDRHRIRRAMNAAIAVPQEVCASAQRLRRISRQVGKALRPHVRVDLRCADALARAAGDSARALVLTNQAWLKQLQLR
ncbi:MAG: cyclodeaminase/cyclohydrolase family protein [Candidatus Omnitrophica bacterium]|nr:cyclodeaminase/cyclohydrolase family protein [Candidatus Omnitrophota bacterium]